MASRHLLRCLVGALAAAALLSATSLANAAIAPPAPKQFANPEVQSVWCALGAHIGPLGACIGGYGWGPRYHYRHCWYDHWGRRVCGW